MTSVWRVASGAEYLAPIEVAETESVTAYVQLKELLATIREHRLLLSRFDWDSLWVSPSPPGAVHVSNAFSLTRIAIRKKERARKQSRRGMAGLLREVRRAAQLFYSDDAELIAQRDATQRGRRLRVHAYVRDDVPLSVDDLGDPEIVRLLSCYQPDALALAVRRAVALAA